MGPLPSHITANERLTRAVVPESGQSLRKFLILPSCFVDVVHIQQQKMASVHALCYG